MTTSRIGTVVHVWSKDHNSYYGVGTIMDYTQPDEARFDEPLGPTPVIRFSGGFRIRGSDCTYETI